MNNNGYYGDFESLAEEQAEYQKWWNNQQQNQEPYVVPCKCGNPMYETEEMCDDCKLKERKE